MPKNSFTMRTQKRGRMKYLLLTVFPPVLIMALLSKLADYGILPNGETFRYILLCSYIITFPVLGYFLIYKKDHTVDVMDNRIIETGWRQREVSRIKASQIQKVKRNFLNEIILIGEDGKKLLCIESNMDNVHKFEEWLVRHNIY